MAKKRKFETYNKVSHNDPRKTRVTQSSTRSRDKPPTAGSYTTGYGRPPTSTQFQRGRSGNPKGRPKKRRANKDFDRARDPRTENCNRERPEIAQGIASACRVSSHRRESLFWRH